MATSVWTSIGELLGKDTFVLTSTWKFAYIQIYHDLSLVLNTLHVLARISGRKLSRPHTFLFESSSYVFNIFFTFFHVHGQQTLS